MLGDDGRLPAPATIERSRAAFARARAEQDWEGADALTAELDDLASVGWVEAGALRDEISAWLELYGDDAGDLPDAGAGPDGSAGQADDRGQGRRQGPRAGEGR